MDVTINIVKVTQKTISISLPYYYKVSISTDGRNAYDQDTYGCILKDTRITINHLDEYMRQVESYDFTKQEFRSGNQADESYFHPDNKIKKSEFDEAYERMQAFVNAAKDLDQGAYEQK